MTGGSTEVPVEDPRLVLNSELYREIKGKAANSQWLSGSSLVQWGRS